MLCATKIQAKTMMNEYIPRTTLTNEYTKKTIIVQTASSIIFLTIAKDGKTWASRQRHQFLTHIPEQQML